MIFAFVVSMKNSEFGSPTCFQIQLAMIYTGTYMPHIPRYNSSAGLTLLTPLILTPKFIKSYLIFVIFSHARILSHENLTLRKCVNLR